MKRLLCLFLIFCSFFCGCSKFEQKKLSKTEFIFDTICEITIDNGDTEILNEAFALCKKYDEIFSKTNEISELNKINNSNEDEIEISYEMNEILEKSFEYSNLSNGKFNVVIKNLTDLWDFKSDKKTVPNDDKINKALATINHKNISLNNNKLILKGNAKIDLGGIAKGYIADKIKDYLIENDVAGGLINLGGNIVVFGEKESKIGVQKPFAENGDFSAVLNVKNCSVVTSGNYQRYFVKNNVIYHHILDTKTGMPINNNLNSVTVISKNSVDADALSTTFFSLGIEKSLELLEKFDDTEAIFLTKDKKIIISDGLSKTNDEIPIIKLK